MSYETTDFIIPKVKIEDSEYTLDIETAYTDKSETSVYAYIICLCNINNTKERYTFSYEEGDNCQPMIKCLNFIYKKLPHKNIKIYIHNAKFDFSYIRDVNYHTFNIKSIDEINKFDTLKDFGIITENQTKNGIFYRADVRFIKAIKHSKNKKTDKIRVKPVYYKTVSFIDSLKMIPLSLDKILKEIVVDMRKGKLKDGYLWNEYFPYIVTDEKKEYCMTDVVGLSEAIKIVRELGICKNTLSASAFYIWKINRYKNVPDIEKAFREEFPVINKLKVLNGFDLRDNLKLAYVGGYTQLKKGLENVDLKVLGYSFDVNSLYPYIMKSRLLPYGAPVFVNYYEKDYIIDKKTGEKHECLIYIFYANDVRLKDNKFPTVKSRSGKDLYCEVVNGWQCLAKPDFERFLKNYDVDFNYNVEYITTIGFKGKYGIFDDYVDFWQKVKQENKGKNSCLYTLAKLFSNSLYGKWGQDNTESFYHTPCDRENFTKVINYTLNDEKATPINTDDIYLPLAVFITAYAREVLFNVIDTHYEDFLYCDTDSVYLTTNKVNFEVDSKKLGAWDNEHEFDRFKGLGPKKYMIHCTDNIDINGKTADTNIVKCAGLNDEQKEKLSFDNFTYGILKDKNGEPILIKRSRITKGGIKIYTSPIHMTNKTVKVRTVLNYQDNDCLYI